MTAYRVARRWQGYLAEVSAEYAQLAPSERRWIDTELARIATLQRQLDALFLQGDGPAVCRRCRGACCDCGKNHFTLVNLLAFLSVEELPPTADFTLPCPFLGPAGCRLEVSRRPFNCALPSSVKAFLIPSGKRGMMPFMKLRVNCVAVI
jgi:hypothetical protein